MICDRCGMHRRILKDDAICGHCALVPEHLDELTDGHWVRDGLIWKWEPTPEEIKRCGTERGYGWHRKHGEPICDDCRYAHRLHRREERAQRAEREAA